jgi:hypothetical protein
MDISARAFSLPDKFAFALWTREMVATLIKDKFAIALSLAAAGATWHHLPEAAAPRVRTG